MGTRVSERILVQLKGKVRLQVAGGFCGVSLCLLVDLFLYNWLKQEIGYFANLLKVGGKQDNRADRWIILKCICIFQQAAGRGALCVLHDWPKMRFLSTNGSYVSCQDDIFTFFAP